MSGIVASTETKNDPSKWSRCEHITLITELIVSLVLFILGTLASAHVIPGGLSTALPLFTANVIIFTNCAVKASEIRQRIQFFENIKTIVQSRLT